MFETDYEFEQNYVESPEKPVKKENIPKKTSKKSPSIKKLQKKKAEIYNNKTKVTACDDVGPCFC